MTKELLFEVSNGGLCHMNQLNWEEMLMKIDITLKITPKMITDAQGNKKKALVGHFGN